MPLVTFDVALLQLQYVRGIEGTWSKSLPHSVVACAQIWTSAGLETRCVTPHTARASEPQPGRIPRAVGGGLQLSFFWVQDSRDNATPLSIAGPAFFSQCSAI